jgi:hypothetical protein
MSVLFGLALLAGCIDAPYIPPTPEPVEIVKGHAAEAFARAFAEKPDAKEGMGKFKEKLGSIGTTRELREAWKECFPGMERVLDRRVISRAIHDPHWPVMGVNDDRVFVEGVAAAAEEFVGS